MKNKSLLPVLILTFISLTMSAASPTASQTRQIVDNMLATIAKHQGAEFNMAASERLVGKPGSYNQMSMFTKVNVNPLKIYAKVLSDPNKGTELLYVTGQRDNKIRVNPGKFLPTLTLAPTSNLLSKNQHHTLLTSGFMIVHRIVADGVKRADAKGKFDDVFKYDGEVTYQNKKCYKIVIDDPSFTYTTAVGLAGENVNTLAKRLLVSEYHIMELNPSFRNLDDNVAGKTLKVPTSYAKKSVLYIDEATNIPVYQEMSDEKGIFEKYEYSNVVFNPAYKADEFSEKFSEYKF
jgi:outer membrane lipoprotein-sorting protein